MIRCDTKRIKYAIYKLYHTYIMYVYIYILLDR